MSQRILILSTVHSLGHPRHTMKLGKGLAEAGFSVELWGRGAPPEGLPENLKCRELPKRGKWTRLLDLPEAFLRGIQGGHDLVIVVPPETVPVGLLLRLFGKKVIWDVEEDSASAIEHSDWMPEELRKPIASIFRWVERMAARLLPAISIAEEGYRPRFKHAKRVEVIHNYPPRPPKKQNLSRGATAKERWSLPGPRLVYVGSVTEHRGIIEAIRSVELLEDALPDIQLDILGGIPQADYYSRIMVARSRLIKPERIVLHGQVNFNDLSKHLETAQIGLLPLWPQPNHLVSLQTKLFEYALAGLPTVVGDVPLWRTLMDASKSGEAAEPRNPQEWADAIQRLWGWGPRKLAEAGRRAHDLVMEKEWFWDVERARLAALCTEVIEGKAPGKE